MTDQTNKIVEYLSECTAQNEKHNLYALLDTARNDRIQPAIMESGCDYESLYPKDAPPPLAEVAPHIVRLDEDHAFLRWLIGEGWGDSWGVFLLSSASLQDVRSHFRKFLKAQTEDGDKLLFRFYDPRVLRVYLPTCNAIESSYFFGPAGSFVLEDDDPKTVLRFYVENGELRRVTHHSSGGPSFMMGF